jgi:organic radical activating enzyme
VTYPIADIFHSLQGEGHFVGYPMTFVRLAGCSVINCHIRQECDEAPWKMKLRMPVEQIVADVKELCVSGIVCITGGEPTDHELLPLVCALHDAGYRVHLETSGVRPVTGMPLEWLTVSPKVFGNELKQRVGHTLKVVVRPEWTVNDTWSILDSLNGEFFHRYLQPMTGNDGEPANLPQVIELLTSVQNSEGRWALSVQAHRLWSVQ